jgi:putative spermidine/putrescine transport system substrate-binding protein
MRRFCVSLIIALLTVTSLGTAAQDTSEPPPGFDSWEAVLADARGTTVNWHMWGGSAAINEFVDTFYGEPLMEEYGITLNRIPVNDIVDTLTLVLNELEAAPNTPGSVDLIWINGENFFTLKQADALYGPWAENIPNSELVDWDNPAIAFDFGVPVDGLESPWASAQFQFIYDTARMDADELPRNYDELTAWIEANPGRFTYIAPGPGAFQGTRFVKQVLYHVSGGYEQWTGEWNPALFDENAPALWELLNTWEPNLWRNGETYPATENELHALFANGEVDFTITQATAGSGPAIEAGLIPPTAKAFVFDEYMIGDYSYLTIPSNAPNKAAALVTANLILRPDRQAGQILPETGFGLGYAIDINRVEDEADRELLQQSLDQLGDRASDPAARSAAFAPDMAPESQVAVEEGWEANVLQSGR